MGFIATPPNTYDHDMDLVNLGLAKGKMPMTTMVNSNPFLGRFAYSILPSQYRPRPYSTEELGAKMARMKIYKPEKFDNRMKFVNSEIQRRYVPAGGGKKDHYDAQDNGAFIRTAYNKAFKSKTYTDAMKAYELRMQQPDRYIPAGHKSLENIDLLAERGGELQRRGIFGRRRSQSLVGEAVAL